MVKPPAAFADTPVLSLIPDIPYYYANVRGISFLIDLLLLCTLFAELMRITAARVRLKGRFGAILGIIMGAGLTFVVHGAGYTLLQHWLTGIIIAATAGTVAYRMTRLFWGRWWALLFGTLMGLFVLGIALAPNLNQRLQGIISLVIIIAFIAAMIAIVQGFAAGATPTPEPTPPEPTPQGPQPTVPTPPGPTPQTPPTPTPPVPPPTPIPPHPKTPKYNPNPPKPYKPIDPPSPRMPDEPLVPSKPPLPPATPENPIFVDLSPLFLAVGNQNHAAASAPFAVCAIKEYIMNVQRGVATPENELSPLYLWYHARTNKQANSGCNARDVMRELTNRGVCSEQLWEFEPVGTGKYLRAPPAEADADALNHRISGHAVVATIENEWAQSLRDGNPMYITITVPINFFFVKSNFYERPTKLAGSGGHALVVVGYHSHFPTPDGRLVRAFKVRNSWGTGWGENGYTWIPADVLFKLIHSPARIITGWQGPAPEPPARQVERLAAQTAQQYHAASQDAAERALEAREATELIANPLMTLATDLPRNQAANALTNANNFAEYAEKANETCQKQADLVLAVQWTFGTCLSAFSVALHMHTAMVAAAEYLNRAGAPEAASTCAKAADKAKEHLDKAKQLFDDAKKLLDSKGPSPDVHERLLQANQSIKDALTPAKTVAAIIAARKP